MSMVGCMKYKISILMPALNEEKNIQASIQSVLDAFAQLKINGEIVVINDGSRDRTAQKVEEKQKDYKNIKLVSHTKNRGVGASYWTGLKAAEGEIITWIPADGEASCYESLRYLPLMDHVDLVVPYIFNRQVRGVWRNILSRIYKRIINLTFGTLLNYTNGATIYRKCVLDGMELKTKGFFFQVEMLMKSLQAGYLFAEVPCSLNRRISGRSKALTLRSLMSVSKGYFSTTWVIYKNKWSDNRLKVHPDSVTARRWAEVDMAEHALTQEITLSESRA